MHRHLFRFSRWLTLLAGVLAFTQTGAADPPPRPHIVLIVCDDLGYSDLGCYGGEIRTPNLDRLARDGVRFTQFYNNAVCVTTRASLITGLYPRPGTGGLLRQDMVTIGEVMRDAGYHTVLTGKWHLGDTSPRRPNDRGFEECYGLLDGCCNFFNPAQRDPVFYNGGRLRSFFHNERRVTEFPSDYYTTDAFAEHASENIRRLASSDRPMFLHVAFTAPHFPLHAKPEDIARYRGKYDDGYFELRRHRFERQKKSGVVDPDWQLSPVDRKLGDFRYDYEIVPWDEVDDLERERARMEVYAAMVDSLDQAVGRILNAIQQAGIADQTLVLFFSDNGGCASLPADTEGHRDYNEGKLPGPADTYDFCGPGWGWAQCTPFRRYKVWNYEGGISTPMIARWPKVITPGTMNHQVGHVIDILPTCLELAGGQYPSQFNGRPILPVEGKSLVPLLHGQDKPIHDTLYWSLSGNRAVREGNWKLVWGASARRWELYDMERDRTETNDLTNQHPDIVGRLKAKWETWARETSADGA